jgi:hypothetical protein
VERARLKVLPPDPSEIEERPTGKAVGDVWAGLTNTAKRKFLEAAGVQIHVRPESRIDDPGSGAPSRLGGLLARAAGPKGQRRSLFRGRRHAYWVTGDAAKITGELQHLLDAA